MSSCKTPSFTLCVPTFNRGNRVVELVSSCLPLMDDDWDLLVLDNCSDKFTSCYEEIQTLSKLSNQLNYIKHDSNRMFAGNFLACFDYSRSPLIMIISDEDIPNFEFIRYSILMISENPNLGLIAGSVTPQEGVTPGNSFNLPDAIFNKGKDALLKYGFMRNYISGGVYNRAKVLELDLQERLRSNITKHWSYPHLYLEILLAARCDIRLSSIVSCYEGQAEATDIVGPDLCSGYHTEKYKPPYSFGARIDQFIALRDAAYEATSLLPEGFDLNTFFSMYISLFSKYLRLVGLSNAKLYIENTMFPALIQESLYHLARSSIVMYEELRPFTATILELLEETYEKNKLK
ncbi:MAG: glycosyltransferase [Opitutales bacterium]|nr:glycosyltransferase [Opitutales bacterium]